MTICAFNDCSAFLDFTSPQSISTVKVIQPVVVLNNRTVLTLLQGTDPLVVHAGPPP